VNPWRDGNPFGEWRQLRPFKQELHPLTAPFREAQYPEAGWQCHCCDAVYGPAMKECRYCNPEYQSRLMSPDIKHRCKR
jgi:hypothetical protein